MSLWSILKVIFALPRAFCLFCQILGNCLLTGVLDEWPSFGGFIAIAWSFDTTTGLKSINRKLAEKVYYLLKNEDCLEILLQEEIYNVLLTFCLDGLDISKVKVVKYNGREYINAKHVLDESFDLSDYSPNKIRVMIVSHNHMFTRLRGMLTKMGAVVCGHLTVIKYDNHANQSKVRSKWAFAGYEPLAYLAFVLMGYI